MRIRGRCHCGNIAFAGGVWTFEDFDPARLDRARADFEGEDKEARLARRVRHWIGDVRFTTAATPAPKR